MKRSLRALTAASVIALSAPAFASETSFDWGGQANFSAYAVDQADVPGSDVNDFGFAAEGKTWGRVRMVTDEGLEMGLRASLRFQSPEAQFTNEAIRGAPDYFDEAWAYVQTAFGRLTVGFEDGAADSAGIFSPTVSDINRIDDPRGYPIQDPLSGSFTPFAPNGAHMRTDLNASGDAFKAIYYSPRLIGVQLSASYMPELTRGVNDLFKSNADVNRQSDIWEVGLNYQGSLSSFDVGFYAGYVAGSNDHPAPVVLPIRARNGAPIGTFLTDAFTPDDLQEWGAGAQVVYQGFKLGGSYRSTNIAGGGGLADGKFGAVASGCFEIAGCVLPKGRTTIWGAGVEYETGPWTFGVNYQDLKEELPGFRVAALAPLRLENQDAKGWMGGIGYEFDENLKMGIGYQHYEFNGPANACVAAACDTMDANLGYFETSITF